MNGVAILNRQQKLVCEIVDYLTDWSSDETSILKFEESIDNIESYGVNYSDSSDELVINAIRHLVCIVNPWNKAAIPDILESIGFIEEEIKRYNTTSDSVIRICFG